MVHAVHVDDEITDQGLVAAEVAVLEPPHRPLVDRVERRRRSGLGDAGEAEEAAQGGVEGRQREVGGAAEARGGRVAPVDVEFPDLDAVGATEVVAVDLAVVGVRGAHGRGRRAIEVAGQHHVAGQAGQPGDVELDEGGRVAVEHVGPVEGHRRHVAAEVRRHVVGVRPDAQFEVVGERAHVEFIEVISPGDGIRGARDGDAHVRGAGELAEQPAICQRVIENNRVAQVLRRAGAGGDAGRRPERVDRRRPRQHGASLAVDREHGVDHLDVVARPDVADRVMGIRSRPCAVEVEDRRCENRCRELAAGTRDRHGVLQEGVAARRGGHAGRVSAEPLDRRR